MGYDVHITRAENWFDAKERPITLEEWLECARLDSEMRVDGRAEAKAGAAIVEFVSQGLAVWTAYSGDGADGNHAWFNWEQGCVVVKNPDSEILGKMFRLAQLLDARVQGDEGEMYGPNGDVLE